jgi:hypothetical protein
MLQRMLDAHPDVAFANDSHFIPWAIEAWISGGQATMTDEIAQRVTGFKTRSGRTGFFKLGLSEAAIAEAQRCSSTYAEFVSALYTKLAERTGKRLAGEKTPDYVRCIPLLHELWPQARFVHIVRDPRDTTLAILDWARDQKGPARFELWPAEPVAAAALWLERHVMDGRRDGSALSKGQYLEVHFENLVRDPEGQLRCISNHIGIEFDPAMTSYFEGRTLRGPGLDANRQWLPPTQGRRDWRTQMSKPDLALLEALVGDSLQKMGYELSGSAAGTEVAALARRCRAWARWRMGG